MSDGDIVQVDRGLQTLIKASIERGDGKDERWMYLQSKFMWIAVKNINGYQVLLHLKENAKMKVPHRAHQRVGYVQLLILKDCFICGLEADVEKEKKK